LLWQIEVALANGKMTPLACKDAAPPIQFSTSSWRNLASLF